MNTKRTSKQGQPKSYANNRDIENEISRATIKKESGRSFNKPASRSSGKSNSIDYDAAIESEFKDEVKQLMGNLKGSVRNSKIKTNKERKYKDNNGEHYKAKTSGKDIAAKIPGSYKGIEKASEDRKKKIYNDQDNKHDSVNIKYKDSFRYTKESREEKTGNTRDNKTRITRNNKTGITRNNKAGITINNKTRDNNIHNQNNSITPGKPIKQVCPYVKKCGGCNILSNYKYEEHLKIKQDWVSSLLSKYCTVENIIGMEKPKNYRNKVHAVFDHDRKGNPISGVYEEGTHNVVPIDSCLIHNQKADEIITSIRGMLKSFKIKTYDEDTGYGLLRHVLIRTGFHSGEIMVVLVLSSPIFPSKNNFVKAMRQLHPEITTIVLNINDRDTNMILGEREQVIYGKGYIEDSLCSKTFRISPKSFYQVNPLQTEVLYGKAIEMAGLTGNETVIDAYCGTGTIGIIASGHAKRVIGVELNKDAVRDAVMNAKRNEIKNTEFINDDAGEFMGRLADNKENVDTVFLDPPRSGSDEKFLNALCLLKPEKVVYISCNPVTLERDLQYLTKKGYKAKTAVPVDMFPWTEHVETVVLMSRVKE